MSRGSRGADPGREPTRAVVVVVVVTGVAVPLALLVAPPVVGGLLGATGAGVALILALYQEHACARRERADRGAGEGSQ